MSRRVLRYEVAVNDRPRTLWVGGDPLRVAAARVGVSPRAPHIVEFWAEGEVDETFRGVGDGWADRTFSVVGTGHLIPPGAVWRGTCERTPDGLVWHLYELLEPSHVPG